MGSHAGGRGNNKNAPADKMRPGGSDVCEEAGADAIADVSTKATVQQGSGTDLTGKAVEQVNAGRLAIENGHEGHAGRGGGDGGGQEKIPKGGAEVDVATVSARSQEAAAAEGDVKPHGGVPGEGRRTNTGTMVSPAPQGASSTKPTPATSGLSEAIGKLGRDLAEVLAQRRKQAVHGCGERKDTERGSAVRETESTSAERAEKVVSPSLGGVESSVEKVENEQRDGRRLEDKGGKGERLSDAARAPAGDHLPGENKAETQAKPKPAHVGSDPEKSDDSQGVRRGPTSEDVRAEECTKTTGVSDVEKEGQASSPAASSRVPGHAVPRGDVAMASLSASAVESDPQLECTLRTLEAVHAAYFSRNEKDVERRSAGWTRPDESYCLHGLAMALTLLFVWLRPGG